MNTLFGVWIIACQFIMDFYRKNNLMNKDFQIQCHQMLSRANHFQFGLEIQKTLGLIVKF